MAAKLPQKKVTPKTSSNSLQVPRRKRWPSSTAVVRKYVHSKSIHGRVSVAPTFLGLVNFSKRFFFNYEHEHGTMGRFYSTSWDPRLIVSQIILIQCAHYIILGIFLWILDAMAQRPLSMDQIFNYREINFSPGGTVTTISFLLTSLVG
jgi:hypothetical protein